MADVFLSYSQKDRVRAQRISKGLHDAGWTVWWDVELYAGTRFRDEIARQLHAANCVVVLWSQASVESGWVIDEAEDGRQRGVLVQALLDSVQPPYGFRGIQSADLIQWNGDLAAEGFVSLTKGVAHFVSPHAAVIADSRPTPGAADPNAVEASSPVVRHGRADGQYVGPFLIEIERIVAAAQARADDPRLPSVFRNWRTRVTSMLRQRLGHDVAAQFAALCSQSPIKDRQARVLAEALECRQFLTDRVAPNTDSRVG